MSNRIRLFIWYGTFILLAAVSPGFAASVTNTDSVPAKNCARLKEILPFYESALTHPWPIIPLNSPLIQEGSKGELVLLLRERLRSTNDLLPEQDTRSSIFDQELADAVKSFQWRHGLAADSVVGTDTKTQLNVSPAARVKQIQVNIQRWTELGKKVKNRYLIVNIPEYRLHLIENNQEALNMKVIVGKLERQTPELSSVITRIVFNPTWSVPQLIAQKDLVPKVLNNSNYLEDMHIRIFSSQEDGARELNSSDVDWQDAEQHGFRYFLRQEPGEGNALGLVKFEFQNDHSVYLHDTPAKNLFEQDKRDLSSGCVRLENPFELVDYLVKNDAGISEDSMHEFLDSQKTHYYKVKIPLPIYITYITAWVDEKGITHFLDDIYGRDTTQATS
jgi:murein L,D-transpeptidase YcbB/YkuD